MVKEIDKEYKTKIAKPNVERAILSICLQDSQYYIEIKNHDISGDMFLIDANKYIFYSIEYLLSKQQTPTPISVLEVITDKNAKAVIENFGGIEYLTLLTEQRINVDNIPILCDKLKQAYTRSQLYLICEESKERLLSSNTEILNPSEIIGSVENKILELSNTVQQTRDVYKMGDDTEEILELRSKTPNSVPGLELGWSKFDYYTNGGQPGDLFMICARAKCVDADTEYFNGYEWKRIADYNLEDMVLQYNLDGTAELVKPLQYIKTPCDMMYYIETQRGVNIMASSEHKMLSVIPSRKGEYCFHNYTMEEIYKKHTKGKGFVDQFLTTFKYNGKGISLTDAEIKIMCAVICDGHFPNKSNLCRINLKKPRKKERLKMLLKEADIEWREKDKTTIDGYTEFYFYAPRNEKIFSKYWYSCSNEQLKTITDEVLNWDGCKTQSTITFSTSIKETADFLQFAWAATGKRASIKIRDRRGRTRKINNKEYIYKSIEYDMHITDRTLCGIRSRHKKNEIKKVTPKDGYKYCFTVPSSYLVLRRGNSIMIHHNCGKSTILTNWATKFAIKDKLPVLYFDTEMDARQQEDRILSILSGIPHKEIVSGMYVCDTENGKAEDKIEALHKAIDELKTGNYYHIYMPNFTIDKVNAISKKFKMQNDIQAIFFDYLKFPPSQLGQLKSAAEWQMLGYIASGLKDLAGTLEIPIYSACQENRVDPKGNKKSELNVGGSDRILQLASKLIFLQNKSEEDIMKEGILNGNQTLYIAYQRNGESDVPPINIMFDRPILTQKEV